MTTAVPKTTGSGDFASTEEPVTTEAALDDCAKLASQERASSARMTSAISSYKAALAQSKNMCARIPPTMKAMCENSQKTMLAMAKSRVDMYTANHLKLVNDIRACKGLPTKPTASTAKPQTPAAVNCTKLQAQAQAAMKNVTKTAAAIATQTKGIEAKCARDTTGRCKRSELARIGSMKRYLAMYQRRLAQMQADLKGKCQIVLSTPTSSGTQTTPEPETTMPVTTEATGCAERKKQAAASAANLTRYTKRYNYERDNMRKVCLAMPEDKQVECKQRFYRQLVGLQADIQEVTANHKQLMVRWTRPSCCLPRPRQLQSFFLCQPPSWDRCSLLLPFCAAA